MQDPVQQWIDSVSTRVDDHKEALIRLESRLEQLQSDGFSIRESLARIEAKVSEDDRVQDLQFSQINARLKNHQSKLDSVHKVAGGITALASALGGLLAYLLG